MDKSKENNIDSILMQFKQMITKSLFNEAQKIKMPFNHYEIIMSIGRKGSMTMKEIASVLNITPPSASTLVDILEDKELVVRVHLNKDKRTTHVILGENSKKFFSYFHKRKTFLFKETLNKLSEKDRDTLVKIIKKCLKN